MKDLLCLATFAAKLLCLAVFVTVLKPAVIGTVRAPGVANCAIGRTATTACALRAVAQSRWLRLDDVESRRKVARSQEHTPADL